jgi:hypothetical protein
MDSILHGGGNNMKPLEKEFIGRGEVRGFIFTQILMSDKAYLYQVKPNGAIQFEVFKKRENTRFGTVSYPTSNAFGRWAFTYENFASAKKKFDELNEEG